MIIPAFDMTLARSMLEGGTNDETLIDRYGELIEAYEDARTELEVTTVDGRTIRLGGDGGSEGPGPEGVDQGDGAETRPQRDGDAPADPGADRKGDAHPGALHGLRGADLASPLDRARILNRSGRNLVDHLLHDPDARRRLEELAGEIGYLAKDQDDVYALLSDLLQHASWAAAGHVYRRLEIEAAHLGRSQR